MTLETFFEKFERFADAPKAVGALRELVLQLAVRGNLTERADGESCSSQLKLADDFRVRRGRTSSPDAGDIPFTVPENWGWVAVGDSTEMINGRAFKPEEWSSEGIPIIRIQNLNNEHAAFNRCTADLDPKIHVHDGDFLISWSGTPGTSFGAFIWNRGFAYLNQHIFRCELVSGVFLKEFLRLAINARLDEMISRAHGAVGLRHITKGKLESIRLPLPPLAEQKRIVAKVDELMALCDRLEGQQKEREKKHAALARASLAHFAEAPTPANLDFLFHKSYTIDPAGLRKTILSIAAQGRLVDQFPDEDPSETDSAEILSGKDQPYALPSGWVWQRLGQLAEFIGGSQPPKSKFIYQPREGYTRFVQIRDFKSDANLTFIPSALATRPFKEDDVMIGRYGPPVFQILRGLSGTYNVALMKAEPTSKLLTKNFLFYLLQEPRIQDRVIAESDRTAGQSGVRKPLLKSFIVGVPPLAEQGRIVAKVEQLMALAGRLEAKLAASRAAAGKLIEAVVAEFTTPQL